MSGCIFALQLRHVSTVRKKLVKQQYLLQMSPQYGELWPTNSSDRLGSLWHPSKFQRVSCLSFVTAATSLTGGQPNIARCLAVSWAGTLYIHFRGLLPPDGILPGAKFTLRPSLAFFYIGSVTARHSSSGRLPNFAAWYKEWNYGTFARRPSRWALAHILVSLNFNVILSNFSSIHMRIYIVQSHVHCCGWVALPTPDLCALLLWYLYYLLPGCSIAVVCQ